LLGDLLPSFFESGGLVVSELLELGSYTLGDV
jgi:hypothetical protein